jgi:steroid delta-isomerase-like uncharacterized protein
MPIAGNKSIIRRYISELNRRNVAILDEVVTDEFRADVRRGYERNTSAFADYAVEILDLIAEGDQVVLEWAYRGTQTGVYEGVPPTGRVMSGIAISIYTISDGRIAAARGVWDSGEVWQQLGLIPDTETILRGQTTTQ